MLELKIGARVMLNKNTDTKSGLVNGAQGVVVDFQTVAVDKSTVIRSSGTGVSVRPEDVLSGGAQTGATSDGAADMPDDTVTMRVPVVRFHHGLEVPVRPVRFQYMAGKRVLARRTQVPLTLAWSITVHRVQGQTLTHMEADASKVFGPGMFYTIASRLTSIDGLRLKSFDPRRIVADARVDAFYQRLHQMAVPPNDD
jgi:ATP-dependent DNA helicase PIF1